MIRFAIEKIALRNVRCYKDDMMEMDFPLDNLTVFTGAVGSGKSTIMKAISMALYGDDGGVKGERLSVDDFVNEKSGKNLEIHVYINSSNDSNGEENKYEVHLYHKHNKMSNKLVFIKDGVDISANGKLETYALIEQTFIPKSVYHNVYYFTQQAKNFFTALPNSEQKEIFDSILGLEKFQEYYDKCRTVITSLESKRDSLQKSHTLLNGLRSKTQDEYKLHIESTMHQISEKTQECEILNGKLNNVVDSINKITTQLSFMANSASSIERKTILESKEKELYNNLVNAKASLTNELTTRKASLSSQYESSKSNIELTIENEKNNRFHAIDNEISEANREIENAATKINEIVAKIKQEYLVKANDIVNDISKLKSDMSTLKDSMYDSIKDEESKYNERLKIVFMDYDLISANKNKLDSEIASLQKTMDGFSDEIDRDKAELQKSDAVCPKCHQVLVDQDYFKSQLQTNQAELSDCGVRMEVLVTQLHTAERDLKILKDKQESIENDKINSAKDKQKKYKTEIEEPYLRKIELLDSELKSLQSGAKSKVEQETKILIEERQSIVRKLETIQKKKFNAGEEFKLALQTQLEALQTSHNKSLQNSLQVYGLAIARETEKYDSEVFTVSSELKEIKNIIQAANDLERDKAIKDEEKRQIESQISMINFEISKLNNPESNNIYITRLSDYETQIHTHIQEIESTNKEINAMTFWKTAFSDSGIKSMLIDSAIPHMNQCVRDELTRVAPGLFSVSFDTLSQTKAGDIRDKFSINIINNEKGTVGHKKLSGGEKRIIDFCCMSALRSLSERLYSKMFCHIFYDEVLDSLDSEYRMLFCQSAKMQSTDHRNITMVTHDLSQDVEPDRVFTF